MPLRRVLKVVHVSRLDHLVLSAGKGACCFVPLPDELLVQVVGQLVVRPCLLPFGHEPRIEELVQSALHVGNFSFIGHERLRNNSVDFQEDCELLVLRRDWLSCLKRGALLVVLLHCARGSSGERRPRQNSTLCEYLHRDGTHQWWEYRRLPRDFLGDFVAWGLQSR